MKGLHLCGMKMVNSQFVMKALKHFIAVLFILSATFVFSQASNSNLLKLSKGSIAFVSDAPLELIQAKATEFDALLDTLNGKFAFSVPVTSFIGFNSPLQQEHFNENYVESEKFANATYSGKIIEAWEHPTGSKRIVRTKGKLTIHGVSHEQLIEATLSKLDNQLHVQSAFKITIADYNIKIPRLVNQKIAEEIDVTVDVYFDLK